MCVQCAAGVSEDTPGWFAFAVSPLDTPDDAPMDMSFLNTPGCRGRVSVRDGRFVDGRGERIRFLGSNVTFSGAFPDKASAPALARRMAQLGFNVLRFHHMDARDIWLPKQAGLDPEKLDRLDWFIHHLKLNGIYVNLNLHVSRTYPGLREMNLARTFRYGKILDTFYDPYIELQERYAADLLDRVNPYTGMKLSEDPAVAFVELNNENTLLNLSQRALAELVDPFRSSLRRKWRAWLDESYGTLDALTTEWNRDVVPLGEEILTNRAFGDGTQGWTLEGRAPDACTWAVVSDAGQPALHVSISKVGAVSWAYQVHQIGIPLEEGLPYTIRFRARSRPARRVSVSLRFAQAPWTILTQGGAVQFSEEWKDVVLPVAVSGVQEGVPLRLSFNLGAEVGDVWLADVSLRRGRKRFEPDVKALSALDLPGVEWPESAWRDFRLFLAGLERRYVSRMKAHLVDRLGVKSLIVDTQASYGGYWGLYREATLGDYIDMHAYWQHPHFPGRPWDGNNWRIANTSMVASAGGGTFERLTHYRLANRPFSVSEYNHPAPNDHAAELFPMLATYAAHQDWDALYQFCYGNRNDQYADRRIHGYFSVAHHAGQIVFAPLAALIFRTGLVTPAPSRTTVSLPEPWLKAQTASGLPGSRQLTGSGLVTPAAVLGTRYAVAVADDGEEPVCRGSVPDVAAGTVVATPQLEWHADGKTGVYLVRAPAARVAVGHVGDMPLELGDVSVRVQPVEGRWACFAMAAADGKPVADSAKVLVALVSRVENTDMQWNEERTTVGRNWGRAPTVALGVSADLRLPGTRRPTVTALRPDGSRGGQVAVGGTAGAWTVRLTPAYETLWYVVER